MKQRRVTHRTDPFQNKARFTGSAPICQERSFSNSAEEVAERTGFVPVNHGKEMSFSDFHLQKRPGMNLRIPVARHEEEETRANQA